MLRNRRCFVLSVKKHIPGWQPYGQWMIDRGFPQPVQTIVSRVQCYCYRPERRRIHMISKDLQKYRFRSICSDCVTGYIFSLEYITLHDNLHLQSIHTCVNNSFFSIFRRLTISLVTSAARKVIRLNQRKSRICTSTFGLLTIVISKFIQCLVCWDMIRLSRTFW